MIVRLLVAMLVLGLSGSVWAQRKPCEELKAEIAARIEANGVKAYTLEVVPADQVKPDRKVVGSCDGGSNRIVYRRGQQV